MLREFEGLAPGRGCHLWVVMVLSGGGGRVTVLGGGGGRVTVEAREEVNVVGVVEVELPGLRELELHVHVVVSSMYTFVSSTALPIPPNTIILSPERTAECPKRVPGPSA